MSNKHCFVPRDAGFFSVFNFFVGGLVNGLHLYPLFNRDELVNRLGNNQHFAYWTDSYNCWFDYFEPMSYSSDDNMHTTEQYLTLPKHSGENAPEEFRNPVVFKALLQGDPQKFCEWRNNTHNVFNNTVKFKTELSNIVNNIWEQNFQNIDNIIGIHYRHPSHFVESGKIYLEQYFDSVDKILHEKPESKIFLASDSQFGIFAFIEKYQDRVIYIKNIDRLTMAEFLHWTFALADGSSDHVGFIRGQGYELHHKRVQQSNNKQMTIDLLTEVLCLSKCDQMINTISNIPLAISYINPKIEIITL
jgi:hypothetical protein